MKTISDLGMRIAEWPEPDADVLRIRNPQSAIRNPQSGFTLVELLIVIAILAILAALLLGVAARAGERGREARTKAMIARIHTLVMEHYDTYKDRRAPVNEAVTQYINSNVPPQFRGQALAEARLYALRELMLLEIPDRWSDVLTQSVGDVSSRNDLLPPVYLASTSNSQFLGPTPLNEAYRRQYFSMLAAGVSQADILSNQGAECLYLFVMFATADGEARSLFNESSIGDTDGDGAAEFLDGWGNPIGFIRWAPGFVSDLQLNAIELDDPTAQPWLEQSIADHDPFDLFRVEPRAFRLVPLIYSAGGDGRFDLYNDRDFPFWRNTTPTNSPRTGGPILSPYYPLASVGFYLGTPMNEAGDQIDVTAAADNIHNHNITTE